MEQDPTQGSTAVADPTDQPAQPSAQPTAGDSGDWLDREPSDASKVFRDLVQGSSSRAVSVTSKPTGQTADAGESTPTAGDVKPAASERGADGRFVPRRGVPQAVAEAEARATAAEARLAELDPATLREQIRAELASEREQQSDTAKLDDLAKTQAADVARYRTLLEVPDDTLYRDDPEGYEFREQFKAKLKAIPEVESAHRELARQTIEAETAKLTARETSFLNGQYEQMARLAAKGGIDAEQWRKSGTTFEVMAEDYATAREAKVRAELGERIRGLEEENRQFRLSGRGGIGSARSGLNGGSSGASDGSPTTNNNELFRALVQGQLS